VKEILAAEGFDSSRLIEKGLVGKSVLPSPSGEIPSVERTDTVLRVGKILAAESQKWSNSKWRKSYHRNI